MNRNLLGVILLLGLALGLAAETVTTFAIPMVNEYKDIRPSIAADRLGNVLVVYSNSKLGLMYYYRKHGTSNWIGPELVPGQPYGTGWGDGVEGTDMAVTKDGIFHIVWCMNHCEQWSGVHYITFNPANESWGKWDQIIVDDYGKYEVPQLELNPVTGDLFFAYTWAGGGDKDCYMMYMDGAGWHEPINMTYSPIAETEPKMAFDDKGRLLLAFKYDIKRNGDWELCARLDYIDTKENDFRRLWSDVLTYLLDGWQFMPSVGYLKGGQVMLVYTWNQHGRYYYIPLQINGDSLSFDYEKLRDWVLYGCPVHPHYTFFSNTRGYVDEFISDFKAPGHQIKAMRYKNGDWDRSTDAISLSGEDTTTEYRPHISYAEPNVGFMVAWTSVRGNIGFSIWDIKKIVVQPPVNLTLDHHMERSLFARQYVNVLTWTNDPLNAQNNVTVSKYNVYRKAKSGGDYAKIGEVAASAALTYVDKAGVSAANTWDYAVTAVDSKGNESDYSEVK